MEPLRLYINNFMCYSSSYIDFSEIKTAVVIGRINNNDLFSNAAGKSTIFKSIEYVLFNYATEGLDTVVREETDLCTVTFDFVVEGQEYRLSRKRTQKGTTDLSLYERTNVEPGDFAAQHTYDETTDTYSPNFDKKFWKDISGRRAGDTEKDLEKLLHINFKLFRFFVHFVQQDFSGLTTATKEKRKGILKDALNLLVYAKLEKLAKEEATKITKEIDKNMVLMQTLQGQVPTDSNFEATIALAEKVIEENSILLDSLKAKIQANNDQTLSFKDKINTLEQGVNALIKEKRDVDQLLVKLNSNSTDFLNKKNSATVVAKALITEIKNLKTKKEELSSLDYDNIQILKSEIEKDTQKITETNFSIKGLIDKNKELNLPLPDENYCKHCRQELSEEHKQICQEQIEKEIQSNTENISRLKVEAGQLEALVKNEKKPSLEKLLTSQKQLEVISTTIENKSREIEDKKSIHMEYSNLFEQSKKDILEKEELKKSIEEKIAAASSKEVDALKLVISQNLEEMRTFNIEGEKFKSSIDKAKTDKAIAQHNLERLAINNGKIEELKVLLATLDKQFKLYPTVIQGFSSTGIPNIIIHGVLDLLQVETNNLLNSLKPGIQLAFEIEKLDDEGNESDILDIVYTVNGRKRKFGLLSGAQQFIVTFSLKLGLSLLLQKMTGVNIKFLLLDEVDQALDKGNTDAFAEVIKFLQNDYKIIAITHNDRLREKFNTAILVDQDVNNVSKAKVVTSW